MLVFYIGRLKQEVSLQRTSIFFSVIERCSASDVLVNVVDYEEIYVLLRLLS